MDFSRVPFNAALDRLGHLLPVGTFARLSCVQPKLASQRPCSVYRCIHVEKLDRNGQVQVTFSCPENLELDHVSSKKYPVDGILNDGPVTCGSLTLSHIRGVMPEAVGCDVGLMSEIIAPELLHFLTRKLYSLCIFANTRTQTQTAVTLADLLSRLGPNLRCLQLPLAAFSDSDNFCALVIDFKTSFPESSLENLHLDLPSFEFWLCWLEQNVTHLAHDSFFKNIDVEFGRSERQLAPTRTQIQRMKQTLATCFTEIRHYDRCSWKRFLAIRFYPEFPWEFGIPLQ